MLKTLCSLAACASLVLAQPVFSAEPVAVREQTDVRGKWLQFVTPIVQKQGDAKLSIIGIRRTSGPQASQDIELVTVIEAPGKWELRGCTAADAAGKALGVRTEGVADSLQTSSRFGICCQKLPKASKTLREVKVNFVTAKVRKELGSLTLEQLRYPCLVGGRIAVQAGEWSLETWPGHYIGELNRPGSLLMDSGPKPTNQTRYLTLRLFAMNRPGEKWAEDNLEVIALDAEGKALATGPISRLGGQLLPLHPSRSYWGMLTMSPVQAQGKASVSVMQVDPFGPAAAAGVKQGDTITHWAGKPIDIKGEWVAEALDVVPGRPVKVTVVRDGKPLELSITSVPDPKWAGIDEPAKAAADWLHKKVGLEQASQFWMYCYVMGSYQTGEPIPEAFTPIELQFAVKERPMFIDPLNFTFRNIPIPEEFWK